MFHNQTTIELKLGYVITGRLETAKRVPHDRGAFPLEQLMAAAVLCGQGHPKIKCQGAEPGGSGLHCKSLEAFRKGCQWRYH